MLIKTVRSARQPGVFLYGFKVSWGQASYQTIYCLFPGFKVKIVGPGRQPGHFLAKPKESNIKNGLRCAGHFLCMESVLLTNSILT